MKITVLTATFNRAALLPRLFASLKDQTCFDFEWLVVDDGSTDNTAQLLEEWRSKDHEFPITYFAQDNSGKHVALNRGIAAASGDYCFIVDSDDWLPVDSIQTISAWLDSIGSNTQLAGVAGLKSLRDGTIPGGAPNLGNVPYVEMTNLERSKFRFMGDKAAEVYRTSVLRDHPFPVFPGETFLHEAVIWNEIALTGMPLRWHPKVIYVCEYANNGLSTKSFENHVRNFEGYAHYIHQTVGHSSGIPRLRTIGAYAQVARARGLVPREAIERIETTSWAYYTMGALKVLYDALGRMRRPWRQSP